MNLSEIFLPQISPWSFLRAHDFAGSVSSFLFSEIYGHLLILELREHARAKGARDSG